MSKQMCWLAPLGSDGTKVLHLKENERSPWQPYTRFPQYSVPDYRIPGGSKGWATYQKLRKAGWLLVESSVAENELAVVPQ